VGVQQTFLAFTIRNYCTAIFQGNVTSYAQYSSQNAIFHLALPMALGLGTVFTQIEVIQNVL